MTTEAQPAQTSAGEGVNTAATATPATQAATEAPRVFSQDEVNKIVQDRLSEERTRATAKHEKTLTEALEKANADSAAALEKTVEERLNAKLAEQAMTDKRQAIKAEYSLSDAQLARLNGSTPDELATDAEALFSHLKTRTPPTILPGTEQPGALPSIADMSGKEVIANWDALWKAASPR